MAITIPPLLASLIDLHVRMGEAVIYFYTTYSRTILDTIQVTSKQAFDVLLILTIMLTLVWMGVHIKIFAALHDT